MSDYDLSGYVCGVTNLPCSGCSFMCEHRKREDDWGFDMPVRRGIYRHFKGGYYEVIEPSATNTETSEEYVVYKDIEGRVWVRPKEMFEENVGGVPRFRLICERGEEK